VFLTLAVVFSMLKIFTPHLQLTSVLDIGPDMLCALGVEGLLLDLDETLKDYYETSFRPEIIAWIEQMKREHVRLCLVTNGVASRVEPLAETLGVEYVSWAAKPFPRGVRAGIAKLGLDRTRVALVGDQIFADVIAGRLAGVFTILVRPTTTREPWNTHIKRPLERWVLRRITDANAPVPPPSG
jgi:HAD superfamily phosphatase (TIGR01668 family)